MKRVAISLALAAAAAASPPCGAEAGHPERMGDSAAFAGIAAVMAHPRCLNCHTRASYPKQGNDRHQHLFGVQRGPADRGAAGLRCGTCHQLANDGASGVPGAPGWRLPTVAMEWEDKAPGELCRVLLDGRHNGGRTIAQLEKHMIEDPLVQWAWHPGGGRTLPPLDQRSFHEAVRRWVATGAACPTE